MDREVDMIPVMVGRTVVQLAQEALLRGALFNILLTLMQQQVAGEPDGAARVHQVAGLGSYWVAGALLGRCSTSC